MCRDCRHLQHTSPTQVFWRCRWHCEEPFGEVVRCHVLPATPACPHFAPRLDHDHGLSGPAALALREISSGVPAWAALAGAGLAVVS